MFRSFQVHPLHGCMEQFIESDFRRKGILQNNLKWGDFREHFGEVSIGWEFSVLCCWCWVWLFRKKWGGTNKRIYWESNRIFGGVTWFSSTSETSEYGFIRKLWSQEERATTRKKTQELQHQHHQTTTKKHQPNNNYTTWTGHNWTWTNTQETVIATLTKSDLLPSNSSSRKAGDEGCCIFFSAWFGGRNEPSLVVWSPGDGPHRLIDTMFHMLIRTLLHELVHESCSCQTSPVRSGSINRSTKSGEETNHQTLGFLGHHFKDLFWVHKGSETRWGHNEPPIPPKDHRSQRSRRYLRVRGSNRWVYHCPKEESNHLTAPLVSIFNHRTIMSWVSDWNTPHGTADFFGLIHEKPSRKIADGFSFKANENQSFGRWPTFCQDTLIGEVEIQCCRTMRKATTANCLPSSSVDYCTDSQFGNQRWPLTS